MAPASELHIALSGCQHFFPELRFRPPQDGPWPPGVDDPDSLPHHHVVLNIVNPKTTRADAALIKAAIARFSVVETVMMRRNVCKELNEKGLLHAVGLQKQAELRLDHAAGGRPPYRLR